MENNAFLISRTWAKIERFWTPPWKVFFDLKKGEVPHAANRWESFCGEELAADQVLHEWARALLQGYSNIQEAVGKLSKMHVLANRSRFYPLSFVPLTIVLALQPATVLCPTCFADSSLDCSKPPKHPEKEIKVLSEKYSLKYNRVAT